MDRWVGKIAVVTGASSGIGAQVVIDLANAGLTVIGLARRKDRVEALKAKLKNAKGKLIAHECDVSNKESIKSTFTWIENEFGVVNVLINNAGITRCTTLLTEGNEQDLEDVVQTNLLGLVHCTKAAYRLLKKNDAEGHIININSLLGHSTGFPDAIVGTSNIYPGTKYAVTATTEMLRRELNIEKNRKVRVSSISPGLVKTDIFEVGGFPTTSDQDVFDIFGGLSAADVSAAVIFVLGAPQHVSVHEILIRATGSL